MRREYSRWVVGLAAGFAIAILFTGPPAAAGSRTAEHRSAGRVQPATLSLAPILGTPAVGEQLPVFVELVDTPAALVYAAELQSRGVSAASSKEERLAAMAQAAAVAKGQIARIEVAQRPVAAALTGPVIQATEIYRVSKVLNGIAVMTTGDKLDAIRSLPGVKTVRFMVPKWVTSTPNQNLNYINAPPVWNNSVGLGQNLTGGGIRVGIIDTGIDYMHSNFGGTGVLAAYQSAATATSGFTTLGGVFPTSKVVGGYDFAGDAYNGGNSPAPDANPMDCNGHGSHVAGTVAGFGVNANGTTYAGSYTPSTPFSSMLIPPGVAPNAMLYALRVFGCGGSTNLVMEAIEWAMDPNNDGDMSDHLDVINMSLGSNFGYPDDPDAIASNVASLAGVVVVAASGNAGDSYFITSSPASGDRAISVAAAVDGGQTAAVRVNAPAGIAGFYVAASAAFGPPPPAAGLTGNAVLGTNGVDSLGCAALTNGAQIAGNIAILRRGTCSFKTKALNAQNAGAIGLIIANSASAFGNLGDDATITTPITIPTTMVQQADGNTFIANIATLNATILVGPDTLASFSSRGPRSGAPTGLKPEIAAPGVNVVSTQSGVTCNGTTTTGCLVVNATGYLAGNQALTISGTSMATPHIAGTMALFKQLHPDWSVEELKAMVMNGALHDVTIFPQGNGAKYGPGRVGAGREDVAGAAQDQVVAFSADNPGQVSVSFGTEVVGSATITKNVRVANHGTTDQSFTLGITTVVDAPGVSFSLPNGTSLSVPAGQTIEFPVRLDATAAQMNHTLDASVTTTQGGNPRHWLTEEAGYITFSQGAQLKMRVPVYSAPVPASQMSGAFNGGTTAINLTGTDVCTGTLGGGPSCTGSFPSTEESLVSPFELQVSHAPNPLAPSYGAIQYAGVAWDATDGLFLFGVSSWGDWSSPNDVAFNILVDNNNDGTYEKLLFNSTTGLLGGGSANDVFVTAYCNPDGSGLHYTGYFVNLATGIDSRLFKNNVMFLAATPAQLGITGAFKWKIQTCPGWNPLCGSFPFDAVTGPFSWNSGVQGLDFGGAWLMDDLNGSSLPVTYSAANLSANGSLGALLLHHHNAQGSRAQAVLVSGTQSADLKLSIGVDNLSPALGQNITVTVTAYNNGPNDASGVVTNMFGTYGLTFVSASGDGSFDPNTALWTIGSLPNGSGAILHIVLQVDVTGPLTISGQIGGTSPLDPVLANNTAQVTVGAAATADLSVTKSANPPTPAQGQPVTFTITAANAGPDTAFNVVVNDLLNSGFVYQSSTASAGVYNPTTGVWTIASIAAGTNETLTITAFVAKTGSLSNTATVTSDASDPNTANNQVTLALTTTAPIPLLSGWGLLLITAVLALCGLLVLRRSA